MMCSQSSHIQKGKFNYIKLDLFHNCVFQLILHFWSHDHRVQMKNKVKSPKLLHDPYQWSTNESADKPDWQDLIHSRGKKLSTDVNQVESPLSKPFLLTSYPVVQYLELCPLKFGMEEKIYKPCFESALCQKAYPVQPENQSSSTGIFKRSMCNHASPSMAWFQILTSANMKFRLITDSERCWK